MTITLYKTSSPVICTILFGLSESYKITLFKDLILEVIEDKVAIKSKENLIFRDFEHKYLFKQGYHRCFF